MLCCTHGTVTHHINIASGSYELERLSTEHQRLLGSLARNEAGENSGMDPAASFTLQYIDQFS
jgi:hypothetical protein